MFQLCKLVQDDKTAHEDSIVEVAIVKTIQELSDIKKKYAHALDQLVVYDMRDGEEIEWDDIP
jgi:D-alanine-D-alanine ligase-like ATP-grasp enzyme